MPDTEPNWKRIARRWRNRSAPRAVLAQEAGVSVSALRRRARREGWGDGSNAKAKAQAQAKSKEALGRDCVPETVEAARALYSSLAQALRMALDHLRAAPGDPDLPKARDRAGLIKAHTRALFAVLDSDRKLGRAITPAGSGGGTGLDLAAARQEIAGRLARLADAAGAEGVS